MTLGYISRLDTRNFSFEAHGLTEEDANEAMGRLLAKHGQQYSLPADWSDEYLDGIQTTPFMPDHGWRDAELMLYISTPAIVDWNRE